MPSIVKVAVVEVDVHIFIVPTDIYIVREDDETIFTGG